MIKKLIITIFSISLVGISVSLLLKAAIGIGPYDAFTQSFATIFNIRVGTMTMIINLVFFIFQILILGNKFPKTQYLQILVIFSIGNVINLFYYNILNFELTSYFARTIFFFIGLIFTAVGVALVMNMDFIYTPLEGFVKAVSVKYKMSFIKLRWSFDIFCILVSLSISLLFKQDILIREGTLLSFLLFSPILGIFIELFKPLSTKLLVENEMKSIK